MAPEGLNVPLSQKLLRRLEVAGVQVSHEDDRVRMLLLHTTQGPGHRFRLLVQITLFLTALEIGNLKDWAVGPCGNRNHSASWSRSPRPL